MDKLNLFRTLIAALMLVLLAWDVLLLLTRNTQALAHRDLLLICALLWIVSVFFPQNSNDDDWAGQF
jgi:hypothetical protein